MLYFSFYVPESNLDIVLNAVFQTGAGKIGQYDCCAFKTYGEGQFRALEGANPSIGNVGQIEKVKEVKVEMVCRDELIKDAIAALKQAHPYEEVAYHVLRMENY